MTELGGRLKKLISSQGFNNKVFADKIGVAPNYISILFNKKKLPNSFIFKITKVIPDLNINWLEKGEGDMLFKQNSNSDIAKTTFSGEKAPLIKEHIPHIEDAILFSEEELLAESQIVRDWVETIKISTRVNIIKKLKEEGKLL